LTVISARLPTATDAMAFDAATAKLLRNEPAQFQLVTETLFKVITNVIQHPDEAKYLELKCESATYKVKIAACAGGLAFLRAAGFAQVEGVMRLPSPPDVGHLKSSRSALKAVVHRYGELMAAAQAERAAEEQRENEAAAVKLKELQEATKKRRAKVDEAASAERAEILKGLAIDRDDWHRQRDPNSLK